eukprot:GHRR01036212.1.p1 GENE.GHRR01036212.1~~GHRR01036212.1.p1  ORF type:complete len:101 (+),score=22.14 GHRR01036212.1:301-603(+)
MATSWPFSLQSGQQILHQHIGAKHFCALGRGWRRLLAACLFLHTLVSSNTDSIKAVKLHTVAQILGPEKGLEAPVTCKTPSAAALIAYSQHSQAHNTARH